MIKDPLQVELDRRYSYGDDSSVRYTHRLRIDQIRKVIADSTKPGEGSSRPKALDAGCSHGVYSILLAEAGYDVFGIDINEEEIQSACKWSRERGLEERISFRVGDIQGIDSTDSIFDLAVCSEVLEHVDDPARGSREIYRALKPGGRAIISMPNMGSLFGALQWTYRKSGVRFALGKPPLDTFQVQHSRYWFGNILRLLKNSGFEIDRTYSSSHVPFLWKLDAGLEKMGVTAVAPYRIEGSIGTLPLLKYLGFNFIVVAKKPLQSA